MPDNVFRVKQPYTPESQAEHLANLLGEWQQAYDRFAADGNSEHICAMHCVMANEAPGFLPETDRAHQRWVRCACCGDSSNPTMLVNATCPPCLADTSYAFVRFDPRL